MKRLVSHLAGWENQNPGGSMATPPLKPVPQVHKDQLQRSGEQNDGYYHGHGATRRVGKLPRRSCVF